MPDFKSLLNTTLQKSNCYYVIIKIPI